MLARLLFEKPDRVMLDEANGALDEPAERQALSALREALPATTFILIAHRRPTGLGDVREVALGGVAPTLRPA